MMKKQPLNFSQRNGYEDLPTQLKIGEIQNKTRYQFADKIAKIIENTCIVADVFGTEYLDEDMSICLRHVWIEVFERKPSEFSESLITWVEFFELQCEKLEINKLFDLLELLCGFEVFESLKRFIPELLTLHHSVYSFVSGQFLTVADEHMANAFVVAVEKSRECGR